ncbi:hypothetical protein GKC56_07340 [Neisseriaceae bacterium PsAf]|nr:hypothetical protein [Neisseriaceae bacterium PsAf]
MAENKTEKVILPIFVIILYLLSPAFFASLSYFIGGDAEFTVIVFMVIACLPALITGILIAFYKNILSSKLDDYFSDNWWYRISDLVLSYF